MKAHRRNARRSKRVVVKPRNCPFCQEGSQPDWKQAEILRRYTSERGKILAASKTGICPKHQRKLAYAIKRARYLALLPYVVGVK